MNRHVVMFSGGIGSFMAAHRVIAEHGNSNVTLLFTDTMMEDEDLYRFLDDAERALDLPITRISDGRNPWEVFRDERFLGNSRIDPCSKILKRELAQRWVKANTPQDAVMYLGIDWTEVHRYERAIRYWAPRTVEAPMCNPPFLSKAEQLRFAETLGVASPRLYALGFAHNNCGGFCIKAGQAHFKLLYESMPQRYAFHERKERGMQELLGRPVTILTEMVNGEKRPLSLATFRDRMTTCPSMIDPHDIGGCGCFMADDDDDDTATHAWPLIR